MSLKPQPGATMIRARLRYVHEETRTLVYTQSVPTLHEETQTRTVQYLKILLYIHQYVLRPAHMHSKYRST